MRPAEVRVPRRFGRGWPERQLVEHLETVEERSRTFPESSLEELLPAAGWASRLSRSEVAREAPGPPGPVFDRLAKAVEGYEFSDPAIVRGYYRQDGQLLGRRMLLELRTLGFRFLCPVVVSRIRRESESRRTVFGFRYDTLQGHVEDGAEWFLLTKDHPTGRILFSIDARWRTGALPTWWMRLGFPVLAPRSQRLWHRRAHRRLRALAPDPVPEPGRAPRSGTGTAAAALGALTGLRSTASLYVLARHRAELGAGPGGSVLERLLSRPAASPALSFALAGEMAADKWPRMPARTEPPALAGRLAIAGAAGWTLGRQRRRPPLRPAALAAASAAAVAVGATLVRRRVSRRVPGGLLGLGEDVLVLVGAELLARRLSDALPLEERDGAGGPRPHPSTDPVENAVETGWKRGSEP